VIFGWNIDFGSHKKNSSRQDVAVTAVKASAEDQEVRICSTFEAFPNIQILHLTFCITLVFSDFYGDLTLVTPHLAVFLCRRTVQYCAAVYVVINPPFKFKLRNN